MKKKWSKRKLNIKKIDVVHVGEKLTNEKPWFNGVHSFSSVRIVTSPTPPSVLEIRVSDKMDIKEKIGG